MVQKTHIWSNTFKVQQILQAISTAQEYAPQAIQYAQEYGPQAISAWQNYGPTAIQYAQEYGPQAIAYAPQAIQYAQEYGPQAIQAWQQYGNQLPEAITFAQQNAQYIPQVKTEPHDLFCCKIWMQMLRRWYRERRCWKMHQWLWYYCHL